MIPIKSFVGHSFLEKDASLVRSFLDFLDEAQASLPYFSWVNAKEASLKPIDSKVLELFADKNLFIAICTHHEYVIANNKLGPNFFGTRFGAANTFEAKASDWLIQEIGLAIGRGIPQPSFL